ncbi:carboxyltransferase domain-containing protein [Curtobacterium sp. RRHDQ10]|uniref:5-oxoprolinase subunit B/C family protein n=1 Tax=Curtobacterium phyllosphaerae TaxID=3413379 RepID=UPI003BF05151
MSARPRSVRVRPVHVLPVGRDAVLLELEDGPATLALFDALTSAVSSAADRGDWSASIVEVVPAARTVLVRVRPGTGGVARVVAGIRALPVGAGERPPGAVVTIPVVYDGADLAEVAERTGLTVEEVVRRHTAAEYDVAFTGFAPGFAYLSGGDPTLVVRRRSTPRTTIPAGAVGLAGPFSGVYPRSSPGGWQLVGRTALSMWDLDRTPPALLRPGMRVRFTREDPVARRPSRTGTAVDAVAMRGDRCDPSAIAEPRGNGSWLEVLDPGLLSLVEDLGRPGQSALGVSGSGAADRAASRRANRLLGNATGAALIEHVGGGLVLRAHGGVVVAVTGASGPLTIARPAPARDGAADAGDTARLDAVPLDAELLDAERDRPLLLRDGDVLVLGAPTTGTTASVAVLGGLAVPPVLGSRSTDVLSGLGPAPLRAGSVLPLGTATTGSVADAPEPGPRLPSVGDVVTVDVTPGPRDDWFGDAALAAFRTTDWLVTPRSNRVGSRLAGPALSRVVDHELPSEATVAGAVQVPADGQPVVFLADHPVTGGYPVIAVVVPEHLGLVAQTPPGARLRFRGV